MRTMMVKRRAAAVFLVGCLILAMTSCHALQRASIRRGAYKRIETDDPIVTNHRRLPYYSGSSTGCDCRGKGKGGKGKGKGSSCSACPPDVTSGSSTPPPADSGSTPAPCTGSGSTSAPVSSGLPAPVEPTNPPAPVEPTNPPGPVEPTNPPAPVEPTNPPSPPTRVPSGLPGGAIEPTNPPAPVEPTSRPVEGDNTAGEPSTSPPVDGDNTAGESSTEPPVDGDNIAGEPTTEPPVDGDNTGGVPTTEPPVDGDNTAGEPTTEPPVDGENTVGEPTTKPPVDVPGGGTEPPIEPAAPPSTPAPVAPNAVPGGGAITPGSTPPPTSSSTPSAPSVTPPFDTEETPDGNGYVSTCKVDPPGDRPAPIVLNANYTYVAIVTSGADITQALRDVEFETHGILVNALLNCMFSSAGRKLHSGVEYTFVSSLPQDKTSNAACESNTVPENQDCYVIDGGITVGYLPPQEESVIMDDVGAILVENYDGGNIAEKYPEIIKLDFVSFTDESTGDDDDDDKNSAGGANGIISDETPSSDRSRGAVAGILVASASVVTLAVLALLLIRRRRRSADTTLLEQNFSGKGSLLSEDSIGSVEDSTTAPHISADSTLSTTFMDQDPKHDVKVCGSSMCPACAAQGPVFVPSTKVDKSIQDIGPPERLTPESQRKYAMTDTVDL